MEVNYHFLTIPLYNLWYDSFNPFFLLVQMVGKPSEAISHGQANSDSSNLSMVSESDNEEDTGHIYSDSTSSSNIEEIPQNSPIQKTNGRLLLWFQYWFLLTNVLFSDLSDDSIQEILKDHNLYPPQHNLCDPEGLVLI